MNTRQNRNPLRRRRLLMALAGVAISAALGIALIPDWNPDDMVFRWTPPTGGSAVVSYDVEIRVGGDDSDDIQVRTVETNEVTFPVEWLTKYEVRVRGVDAQGRRGPWSDWSDPRYRDHNEPALP